MAIAEDLGGYYRVPADNRDLNYSQYFTEGRKDVTRLQDYNSHNTRILSVGEMCEMLMKLECVCDALRGVRIEL
jgi:UDP-glucose 4-epimerase